MIDYYKIEKYDTLGADSPSRNNIRTLIKPLLVDDLECQSYVMQIEDVDFKCPMDVKYKIFVGACDGSSNQIITLGEYSIERNKYGRKISFILNGYFGQSKFLGMFARNKITKSIWGVESFSGMTIFLPDLFYYDPKPSWGF